MNRRQFLRASAACAGAMMLAERSGRVGQGGGPGQ
ncbi:MAG: twin-arginine translocation signal domain-containing protein [Planctomycetota bacterium]